MFYLGIFGLELEKATMLWVFYISTLKSFQTKFCPKIKLLKFWTKIVLIGYFGLEFQKANVEFEISTLEFVNMQSFIQKLKKINLGPKIVYLGIFGLQYNKNYYQISNQHTWICETIMFPPKRKKKKFGNKNALFGSLAGMLKNYSHISNKHPPNCLIAKFCAKIRILKSGTKRCNI